MPIHYQTIGICGESGRILETVRIQEPLSIHGVAGFGLHRFGEDRGEWRVSHIETGSLAGFGPDKEAAFEDALKKGKSKSYVHNAIRRMYRRLAELRNEPNPGGANLGADQQESGALEPAAR